MPKHDFLAAQRQAEAEGFLNRGGIYKYQEGNNRFRLMSECLPHQSEFKGERSFKWLCYVLDRRDAKIKPHFMPHTIYKQIAALQISEDYGFVEVPMPYDLTVHAKGAGTKDVEYTLMPARHELPLSPMELAQWTEVKPLAEVKQALRDKAKAAESKDATAEPSSELDDGDPIPF